MRINDILIESQQLNEGPFTQAIGKAGASIAKGARAIGQDLRAGFKAGFDGGDPAAVSKAEVDKINKIIPTLATQDLINLQTNLEKAIAAKRQAAPAAGAAAKGSAAGQAAPADAASATTPAATPAADDAAATTPAADAAASKDPGAAVFGQMAKTLTKEPAAANTMANTPVSKTNVAKPGNPNAAAAAPAAGSAAARGEQNKGFGFNRDTGVAFNSQAEKDAAKAQAGSAPADAKQTKAQQDARKAELLGKRAAGKTAGTAASGFGDYVKAASSEKIVGANPDGSPKIKKINASKINTGRMVAEGFSLYRKYK